MEEKTEKEFDPKVELRKYVNAVITMSSMSKKSDKVIKEKLKKILENDRFNLETSIKSVKKGEGLSIDESNKIIASKSKKIENLNSVLRIYDQEILEIIKECRMQIRDSDKFKLENTEQMVEKILNQAQEKYPIPEIPQSKKGAEIEL